MNHEQFVDLSQVLANEGKTFFMALRIDNKIKVSASTDPDEFSKLIETACESNEMLFNSFLLSVVNVMRQSKDPEAVANLVSELITEKE